MSLNKAVQRVYYGRECYAIPVTTSLQMHIFRIDIVEPAITQATIESVDFP